MRDEDFELFIEDFGEATHREAVPEVSIERYRGVLPDQLLAYWREEGWCGYADGLFWTVNPAEYDDIVTMWLEGTPFRRIDRYHVVGRTAFGDLYVWGERNDQSFTIATSIHALIAIEKEIRQKEDDSDFALRNFFGSKSPDHFDMKDESGRPLFKRALKKLGPLKPNELYGFEPALVLGGPKRLDNLARLEVHQHLMILRQLAAPSIPFQMVDVGAL